ncbi:MAG: dihydroorotate dehydrogenase [Proteobacteria bacterium]|nr:dihydroorotate dehydrogenase [Pseudomonadota bacterium]MBU1059046.1 dihydroorotate dehydrogenase [Pseudomonadota bacterium]
MKFVDCTESAVDLQVSIGSLTLKNPIMTASGTFGYAKEFEAYVNLHRLGAVVVKGISLLPRSGNPPPRIVETSCGMLNAIGLENVGVDRFISEKMASLNGVNVPVVVNILGDTVEEYREISKRLADVEGIAAIEVNISCPNVKKGGVAFGTEPEMAAAVTTAVKESCSVPVIVKLSPNVSDITIIARAVEEAGADAVSLINTLIGMAIDHRTRRPMLANVIGGLSGPAIKPVALRMVFQVSQAVSIPVIGIGGIETVADVLEFMLAGATAVQIGTANFINPRASEEAVEGLTRYVIDQQLHSVRELIGGLVLSD